MSQLTSDKLVVVGLGFVGLPIALAFSKVFPDVAGFDTSEQRVVDLQQGIDYTNEASSEELLGSRLVLTSDPDCLRDAKYIIVTVPTPITSSKRPDLRPLESACNTIGEHLSPGAIVVFESTVYPTATEEFCGPIIERVSGLTCGVEFKLAYSPERINPGDTEHPLTKITKVVSGQDDETLEAVAGLYGQIIEAGIHRAPSIAVAEAAKVIENTQRDLNIALMNEIAMICDRLGIRTLDVIEAAATKWNFLRFTPGLVGGHCIGVDPYYLTAKAEEIGHHPEVILSGRRINDGIGRYVAQRIIKLLAVTKQPLDSARVGILGLTFKENVPDVRNSKVFDIISELKSFGIEPLVHDPVVSKEFVRRKGVDPTVLGEFKSLNCLVLAVPHRAYCELSASQLEDMLVGKGIFIDVKSQFTAEDFSSAITYWSL